MTNFKADHKLSFFISSYCTISQRSIAINGKESFPMDDSGSLEEHLIRVYGKIQMNYPKFYKMDNLSKLGVLSTEMILKGRNLKEEYPADKIAVVLSNANSSLDTDLNYFESTKRIASPALFVYTLPNIVMGEICIRNGFKGENGFFVFEKFDPQFMASYVNQVLDNGTEVCLAGWVEVLGEQHNVFLYLAEKKEQGLALPHTAIQLETLYR